MASEVDDILRALRLGSMSLDDVAQRFRERIWPPTGTSRLNSQRDWALSTLRDPEPDVSGSFDDVVAAYDRGELTETQYQVLADAVADAIGRKPTQEGSPES